MAAKQDNLLLEKQICFQFYAASKAITNLYRPLLQPLDLTYPQYLVMLVLWEEKQVNVKHLGSRLMLDSGTLTPLLKKLQAKKLITRQRSSTDERQLAIALTGEGTQLREKAASIPYQLICSLGLQDRPVEELKNMFNQIFAPLKSIFNE